MANVSPTISTGTIIKVVVVVLGLAFLYAIKEVLALVFVAWVLASAMFPAVDWFHRRLRIPRPLGLATLYLIIGGLLALVVVLVTPVVADQVKQLAARFPVYVHQLGDLWQRLTNGELPVPTGATPVLPNLAGNIFTAVFGVFSTVLATFLVIVLTFYFTAEEASMRRWLTTLAPSQYGPYLSQLLSRIQHRLGLWLRGQVILSLIVGCLVYVGLTLLDVRYALLLALVAALLEIIPFVGPNVAGLLGVAITLSYDPVKALLAALVYLIVQQLENHLITPRVLGSAVNINPLVVIIAILIGAKVGGIVGALLAVPVAAALAEIMGDVWARRAQRESELA
jgi:predicted PurR-regulated permease PerM